MKPIRRAALAAAASVFVALPLHAQDEVTADTVLATVNGEEITVGHMIVLRTRLPAQYQNLPDEVLFEGILDQLIRQVLLGSEVEGMSKVGRYVLENERRALLATEGAAAISREAVTEEAVEAAYDEAYGNAEPGTEFNASHILVETEEEAAALVEELNGGADFATLAQERSTGPSGPNGGSLGWFGPGMMVPPFEEAVVALSPGEISPPVQTQFGWHVVKLNETRETPVPTLDDVRDELLAQVQEAALDARIAELEEAAEIERIDAATIDPGVIGRAELLQE